jgi:hypothetical protein
LNVQSKLALLVVCLLNVVPAFAAAPSPTPNLWPVPKALPSCNMQTPDYGIFPSQRASNYVMTTFPVRTEGGGLKGIALNAGISCEVSLSEKDGKLIAHVLAKILAFNLGAKDAEGIYLVPPTEKVLQWEGDVDVTTQDIVNVTPSTLPSSTKLTVSVQRL